jgi:translation initiation factor IF-3
MEIIGNIKVLNETQSIGNNGFRKREVVITTEEQYPQFILIEFIQDKCDLLNNYLIGQEVKIDINIRGREWMNPEGVAKYFNAIQGWRIENLNNQETISEELPKVAPVSFLEDDDPNNDLPF